MPAPTARRDRDRSARPCVSARISSCSSCVSACTGSARNACGGRVPLRLGQLRQALQQPVHEQAALEAVAPVHRERRQGRRLGTARPRRRQRLRRARLGRRRRRHPGRQRPGRRASRRPARRGAAARSAAAEPQRLAAQPCRSPISGRVSNGTVSASPVQPDWHSACQHGASRVGRWFCQPQT